MSQRSIALSLITLLAGAAAGAALMTGIGPQRPPSIATAALTAQVQAPLPQRAPETRPASESPADADAQDVSINSLGNLAGGS